MRTIYYAFLLSAVMGLFCCSAFVLGQGFVSEEYQLAIQRYHEAHETYRREALTREEKVQKSKELFRVIDDTTRVMGVELMKDYWASVETYGTYDDSDELPIEDREPKPPHSDYSDDLRRRLGMSNRGDYTYLSAHGDYTKIKRIIRSKKMDYYRGEPVRIKCYLRNDSDKEVHIICCNSGRGNLSKLFHSNYDEAVKTPMCEELHQRIIRDMALPPDPFGDGGGRGGGVTGPRYVYCKLQPGQEWETDWFCLNDYYDLTKPDTYELTYFQRGIIGGQHYDPPLQSNTLTFRVLEGPSHVPTTEERKVENTLIYTNPPPGEEVFKQPQPPKNVFRIGFYPPGLMVPIDVSPTAMMRQWEKTQKSTKTEVDAMKEMEPPVE